MGVDDGRFLRGWTFAGSYVTGVSSLSLGIGFPLSIGSFRCRR